MPALKGLGETYYELAKQSVEKLSDGKYVEYVEASVKYLARGVRARRDVCCLWKILGDCCLLAGRACASEERSVAVPRCIVEKNFSLPEADVVKVRPCFGILDIFLNFQPGNSIV